MRIISGKYSGRKITAPKGKATRPSTDRFRETLFNIIENSLKIDLKGKNILDLFAGSGSLGIEAISRGARSCTFIDNSTKSIKAIENNMYSLRLPSIHDCIKVDIEKIRKFKKSSKDLIDIIFSDPPYAKVEKNKVAIKNLRSNFWLNKKTYIFLEAPVKWLERDIEGFHIIDERKIGDSLLITYLTSNY